MGCVRFGAWSPDMVPEGSACLGVEYFRFEGDEVWEMPDDQAVRMATQELDRIGILDAAQVFNKVRVPNAYPMYDAGYREAVAAPNRPWSPRVRRSGRRRSSWPPMSAPGSERN